MHTCLCATTHYYGFRDKQDHLEAQEDLDHQGPADQEDSQDLQVHQEELADPVLEDNPDLTDDQALLESEDRQVQ